MKMRIIDLRLILCGLLVLMVMDPIKQTGYMYTGGVEIAVKRTRMHRVLNSSWIEILNNIYDYVLYKARLWPKVRSEGRAPWLMAAKTRVLIHEKPRVRLVIPKLPPKSRNTGVCLKSFEAY